MGLVMLGIDPALGGGFARVACDLGEQLTILDAITTYGLERTEDMIDGIAQMVSTYRPSVVVIEYDAQQKGLGNDDRMRALATLWNFDIRPHLTRGQKMDEVFGVASMDQSFKAGDIRIPWGDQETKDRMFALVNQLEGWRPDVKTKDLTQDLVMALWFVWRQWIKIKKSHHAPAPLAPRPSWVTSDLGLRGVALTG